MSKGSTSSPLVGVGVILQNPRGDVLLGERIKTGEPHSWCLPGGRVEAGESFEEAGLRELEEETGIHQDHAIAHCLCVHNDTPVPWLTVGVLVQARPEATPKITEPDIFASWAWFPFDGLPTPLFPATASLMEALRDTTPTAVRTAYVLSPISDGDAPSFAPTAQEPM